MASHDYTEPQLSFRPPNPLTQAKRWQTIAELRLLWAGCRDERDHSMLDSAIECVRLNFDRLEWLEAELRHLNPDHHLLQGCD